MERQIAESLDEVRQDHVERYKFAKDIIEKENEMNCILDAGCGIGYGSSILADIADTKIDCVDNSQRAMNFFQKHFFKPNVVFHCSDLFEAPLKMWYDAIVCFEFLEHIHEHKQAVEMFGDKTDLLICSVPNELVRPHKQEPVNEFHVRHFTPDELAEMLSCGGFSDITYFNQKDGRDFALRPGPEGKFIIAVARKPK